MTGVPPIVDAYWQAAFGGRRNGATSAVTVNHGLDEARHLMILDPVFGTARATMAPGIAERLGPGVAALPIAALRARLAAAGIALHDPDLLFYLPDAPVPSDEPHVAVRRLHAGDRLRFEAFHDAIPEGDREDASVDVVHPVAFGSFDGGRLVSVASACPWGGSRLIDVGVLTLPDVRGGGHGQATVRAIGRHARSHGQVLQYRCQPGNAASVALARACGLVLYGRWEVISPTP